MTEHLVELQAAWRRHVGDDTGPLEGLVARHREPHRRYHGVDHVVWVVRHVAELLDEERVADPGAVVAAAFYHDAVYDPTAADNEASSARLARRDLAELGWEAARIDRVATMIEGTATHTRAPDVDTAVLFDADLAVLAADPAGYRDYVNGLRQEYRHLDDDQWRSGRTTVLGDVTARTSIYATTGGRRRWEHRARATLAAELATLAG